MDGEWWRSYGETLTYARKATDMEHYPQHAKLLSDVELEELASIESEWRNALIEIAEICGEDGEAIEAARNGQLVTPSVAELAISAAKQLRKDYNDALDELEYGPTKVARVVHEQWLQDLHDKQYAFYLEMKKALGL